MTIHFGREICGNRAIAQSREWLVTNGLGGYASGTVAGILTRRYHGLLIAALKPPLGRTLLLSQLDEQVQYNDRIYSLYTNCWADGAVTPQGYKEIESFGLEGTVPVWKFALGDGLLEKRVWMHHGENTTYIRYTLHRGSCPLTLSLKALVNYRDSHGQTDRGNGEVEIEPVDRGLCVTAFVGATPFYLLAEVERGPASSTPEFKEPQWTIIQEWYRNFDLPLERDRGLSDREDRLHAATLDVAIAPGDSLTVVASTQPYPTLEGRVALAQHFARDISLLQCWHDAPYLHPQETPNWVQQLVLAADRFIVRRPLPEEPEGQSIIAGYPWFGDWGRDTMISLPGLTLAAGRPEIARRILGTFARYLDRGMLPNHFPEAGETPGYNTVDAALWYVEALRAYWAATGDEDLVEALFPAVVEIIQAYRQGTRYNIHCDRSDGLIYAGEGGMQLTWMDAKIGDWVVTPRQGKPIEINALWYNALLVVAKFARLLHRPAQEYEEMAELARRGFQRFWHGKLGYCYDVLDTPQGLDASLRPNQIFAVSLPAEGLPLLTPRQQREVVNTAARSLLTSHGLRSLSPDDPDYQGIYGGSPLQRDSAYHQGTVWGWLLGPFIQAHWRVYRNPQQARAFLEPTIDHLQAACAGNLSEIFDGNAPMMPRGAVAQAWTVAEVLRVWSLLGQD